MIQLVTSLVHILSISNSDLQLILFPVVSTYTPTCISTTQHIHTYSGSTSTLGQHYIYPLLNRTCATLLTAIYMYNKHLASPICPTPIINLARLYYPKRSPVATLCFPGETIKEPSMFSCSKRRSYLIGLSARQGGVATKKVVECCTGVRHNSLFGCSRALSGVLQFSIAASLSTLYTVGRLGTGKEKFDVKDI